MSAPYNPIVGPLIQLAIIRPDPILLTGVSVQSPLEIGQGTQGPRLYNALIDTGATLTCISPKVVQEVGLQPMGKGMMIGSTGSSAVNTYHFGIGFMTNPVQSPTGQVTGTLETRLVDGMEFAVHGASFDVLLGRDIICLGTFTLSFDGHMLLAW